jgi:hypothetical protein
VDQEIRNKLRNVVTQCRKLLEDSISQELEGKYGIFAKKEQVIADPNAKMNHLSEEEQAARKDILDHFGHIIARGFKPEESLDQLVREIAFTHLNRLCAYKMMEAREVYVGGQKFREAVSRGVNSNGVMFYLAEHPEEERLFNTGHQDVAYRHFLDWLGGALSDEIGVLFNPSDPANRLYPRQKTLEEVLDLLNGGGIKAEETELRDQWPLIWSQDETIGWVYQYFTPKELRDQARKESQAPRNSYELAFRNQFFTPRYVVEFLTDNTLGRIWYEMRKGETKLKDQCRYMVRRPTEIFLKEGGQPPKDSAEGKDDLPQEELLKLPVHISHRPKKDPRELKILDPACGSGHFLLYCFDLLLTIYEEAYADPDLGPALKKDYPTLDALKRDVPRLILAHNLHGIDIDLRASQIAALALWLRCQRAYQEMGLKKDRPKITRSNFVCAEPMPGEEQMLKEFVGQLEPKVLGQVVEVVFDKMTLAGETGSLLKIEEEIRDAVSAAKKQYVRETTQATDRNGQTLLFTQAAMDRLAGKPEQPSLFDLSDITDDQFFEQAEGRVIETLRTYAEKAQNGQRLQRRLFTEDAVRGFAFVDLCQKRYDVVLMNPPFGDLAASTRTYVRDAFPNSFNDIFCAFVERALALAQTTAHCGAITPRSCFFLSQMSRFRHTVFLDSAVLSVVADLGEGVLDDAVNEVACYTFSRPLTKRPPVSHFVRCVNTEAKATRLHEGIASIRLGMTSDALFVRDTSLFTSLPDSPFVYWVPATIHNILSRCASLEPAHGFVRQGIATTDDVKFVRLAWEVAPDLLLAPPNVPFDANADSRVLQQAIIKESRRNGRWAFHVKAETSQPWYSPLVCVVDWGDNGAAMKQQRVERRQHAAPSEQYYFLPGLSWTLRAVRIVPYIVPAGAIPSASRYEAFPEPGSEGLVLAVVASRVASAYARFYGEKFVWPKFLVDNIRSIPFPNNRCQLTDDVAKSAENQIVARRECYRNFEPFQEFTVPCHVFVYGTASSMEFTRSSLLSESHESAVANAIGITTEDARVLCRDLDEALAFQKKARGSNDSDSGEPLATDSETQLDYGEKSSSSATLSYCIGVAMGRTYGTRRVVSAIAWYGLFTFASISARIAR